MKRTKKKVAPEQGYAFIPKAHAGYIGWQEYQENQKKLAENATQYRCQRQRTPPREGPALLQGLAICGKCGRRMQVQYHERRGHLYPDYICGAAAFRFGEKQCQRISGRDLDRALGELLLATVSPLNLEVALAIERKEQINPLLRGWGNYFKMAHSRKQFLQIATYTTYTLTIMLRKKHKKRSKGWRTHPPSWFYNNHGLFKLYSLRNGVPVTGERIVPP